MEGQSWELISPDLTATTPPNLALRRPITKDNTGVILLHHLRCNRIAFEEGMLWAGSDDGLVHLSRDGGKTGKTSPSEYAGMDDDQQYRSGPS